MQEKYDGGPAFPHIDSECGRFEEGMTLRDYFAAKAMQAIVSRSDFEFEDFAWENAYDMADAMLKAREQK
jgi:hypothetical protein